MRLLSRLAAVAAVVIPSALAALAAPAFAIPTVSVVSKCGYVEITINSDVETTADMNWYADGGTRDNVPIHVGVNVFTLTVNESTSGLLTVNLGESGVHEDLSYVKPEGCHQPILRFKYQMLCGAKALVTVNNIGDAPAGHFSIYRRDVRPSIDVEEPIIDDVTVPVGTSYFLADKLTDFMTAISPRRGTDLAQQTVQGGTIYQEPDGCADAPKVAFAATCTGVNITTVPPDAQITTVVKGQSDDRLGSDKTVAMSTGEALLVKSGDNVIDGFVYKKSSSCDTPPGTGGGTLPKTGSPAIRISMVGLGLVLIGAILIGVRRRVRR